MKTQELRDLSVEEIQNKVIEAKQELFSLRLKKSMRKLENPAKIAQLRKDVARMKTIITEKSK